MRDAWVLDAWVLDAWVRDAWVLDAWVLDAWVLDAWVLVLRCRPHARTGEQDLAAARRRADDHGMTTPPDDPRARFRELPEPVRPEELVETTDADRPVAVETPLEAEWRVALLGPGTP